MEKKNCSTQFISSRRTTGLKTGSDFVDAQKQESQTTPDLRLDLDDGGGTGLEIFQLQGLAEAEAEEVCDSMGHKLDINCRKNLQLQELGFFLRFLV